MNKSKASIFSVIISAIMLILPVAYMIGCKINSCIIPHNLIIICIIVFLLSLVSVLIRRMPGILKIIISTVALLIVLFFFFIVSAFGGPATFNVYNGLDDIQKDYSNFDTSSFGDYKDISYYKYFSPGIFQHEAYTTIVKYDDKNFEKAKKEIEECCSFYSEPIRVGEPVPEFSSYEFDFRIETNKSPSEHYPKQLYLIGINNNSYEIAYIDFQYWDLDTVSDFGNLLDSYCGWQYVINDRND